MQYIPANNDFSVMLMHALGNLGGGLGQRAYQKQQDSQRDQLLQGFNPSQQQAMKGLDYNTLQQVVAQQALQGGGGMLDTMNQLQGLVNGGAIASNQAQNIFGSQFSNDWMGMNGGPAAMPQFQPKQAMEGKKEVVMFWDKDGKKRMKKVAEDKYNDVTESILANGGSLEDPKQKLSRYTYQAENGEYRSGLFDEAGQLKKDMGIAPDKDTKGMSVNVNTERPTMFAEPQAAIDAAKKYNDENADSNFKYVPKSDGEGGYMVDVEEKEAPAATQMTEIGNLQDFTNQLDRIEEMFDGSYVGPIQGRVGAAKEATGIDTDTNESRFRQVTKDIGDTLLRLRSGAQINEQEYQRLLKVVPHANLPEDVFMARLKELRRAINQKMETRQGNLKDVGSKVPGKSKKSDPLGLEL